MLVADKPAAFSPKIALRASVKSPAEIPFKYRAGISASMLATRVAFSQQEQTNTPADAQLLARSHKAC
jgi:hypothetical protein